jgi:hypothetical protein
MVNYFGNKPFNLRLLAKLCEEMRSQYVSLFIHSEMRQLSEGCLMSCVYELKEEMLAFLS